MCQFQQTLMNVRLVLMNVTQTPTASIPLAHTAVSVNLVTKGTDSLVNVSTTLNTRWYDFLDLARERVISSAPPSVPPSPPPLINQLINQ